MTIMDKMQELSRKAIVSIGDTTRIEKVMRKALKEKSITLGFIGGSITEGAKASLPEKRYVNRVAKWWKTNFADSEIKVINAGIGATGSLIGVHRVYKELLQFDPDFVVVEYAVNDDANMPVTGLVYEGLVRRILASMNKPGVMLAFLTHNDGQNAQEIHERIGLHYNLPMVSFRDAMWPEVEEGRIMWNDIEADEVHPNDCGHNILSEFITDRLDEIYSKLNFNEEKSIPDQLHEPLISDLYVNASILGSCDITPVSYGGWAEGKTLVFESGWIANAPDKAIVFELYAKSIGLIYKKYNSYNMGRAEVRIDNGEPVVLEGHFPCYWGGYAYGEIISNNLNEDKHRVEIRFLSDHNPDSTGKEFMVCALLVADVSI